MRQFLTIATCLAVLLSAAHTAKGVVVYSNDFSSPVGPEWSTTITDVTPTGSNPFLGQFGATNATGQSTTLTLNSLPAHSALTVSFDLYIIASWDGHGIDVGPDVWDLSVVGGTNLLHTTFSNLPNVNPGDRDQDYPGTYPGGDFVQRTGCVSSNSLGYHFLIGSYDAGDTTYHLTYTVLSSSATIGFDFSSALSGLPDEYWGLDNVQVTSVPEPSTLVLAGFGLVGMLAIRRRKQ